MSKYPKLGTLYQECENITINVKAFLDGGPIVDWDNSDSHYMTLMRYDGAKLVFWCENRWFAFGNNGRILDKNGKTVIEWHRTSMSKDILEALADYYSGVKKPYIKSESIEDFICSCGSSIRYITDEKDNIFMYCGSGHGGNYKLDMNPNGISTFYFK